MVVIAYPWHDSNKGDAAILEGILTQLRVSCGFAGQFELIPCVDPGCDLGAGMLRHNTRQWDIAVRPPSVPAFPKRKLEWSWRIPRALIKLAAPRFVPSRPDEAAIERSDGVILTGGLYLAFPHTKTLRPPFRLFAYLYPAFYAKRLGKPVVFWGHSLGPFQNKLSQILMQFALQDTVVIAREGMSAELARKLAKGKARIVVAPDAAFAVSPQPSSLIDGFLEHRELNGKKFIVFAPRGLRGYGWSADAERRYLEHLASVAKGELSKGHRVVFVAHTQGPTIDEDDRLILQELRSLLRDEEVDWFGLDEDPSPRELAYLYSKASIVIATRFHGAVLSILGGTPTVAIPYFGTKTQGFFADMGLQDFVVQVDDGNFGEQLSKILEHIWRDYEGVKEQFTQVAQKSKAMLRRITVEEVCSALGSHESKGI